MTVQATAPTVLMSPQDFAAQIKQAWHDAGAGVFLTAQLYAQAKRALGGVGWADLTSQVPHSRSTAVKLALVGEWITKADQAGVPRNVLPSSWGTLYALTSVDLAALKQAIAKGDVHPGIERPDVARLFPKPPSVPNKDASAPTTQQPDPQAAAPTPTAAQPLDLAAAVEALCALRDASPIASYKGKVPRAKLAVALAFLTAVSKLG